MVLSQDYLTAVSGTHGDSHVRPLEMEIVNLKRQLQMNKQSIGQHKSQIENGIEAVRPGDVSKINCTHCDSLHQGDDKKSAFLLKFHCHNALCNDDDDFFLI